MAAGGAPGIAASAAARVARASYGRLLAFLATRWRDVAAAEDALADAFAAALESWPRAGVPASPEAWLLAVARRKLTDRARGQAVRAREDVVARLVDAARGVAEGGGAGPALPDERLRLMLACAHPALDPTIRPALILQIALGVEVAQMAGAFLLSPGTLNKRLVRAKAKIKAAGIRFEEPAPEDLGPRLHALLEAIYAAYAIGREGTLVDGDPGDQLRDEALYLAGLVAAQRPGDAEVLGFHALLLFCEARRPAQRDAHGEFVPLLAQDPARWDATRLRAAYEALGAAAALRAPGPFQVEAAIQAAHCYRARTGVVPWGDIAALYATLVELQPTIGATVGMAVARAHAHGPAQGLAVLDAIDAARVDAYQPYWVARGHLLDGLGALDDAARCLERALGLTTQPAVQRHLAGRLAALRRRARTQPDP